MKNNPNFKNVSLSEVHGSVDAPARAAGGDRPLFFRPAYLVSVGYMDPGNWATILREEASSAIR